MDLADIKWEDVDLIRISWADVDLIRISQDIEDWRALVNKAMKVQFVKRGDFRDQLRKYWFYKADTAPWSYLLSYLLISWLATVG